MQEKCGVDGFIGWKYMKLYHCDPHGPSQLGSALETLRYSPLLFPLPSVFIMIGNGWFMNKRELASNVHQAYKLMKPAFSILVSNRFWPYNIAVSCM
jgi:chromate transport protein ChrA